MSCGNKEQIRGGYINGLPNFTSFLDTDSTNKTKEENVTKTKEFYQIADYKDFLSKLQILVDKNPELINFGFKNVLEKINGNIVLAQAEFEKINFATYNQQGEHMKQIIKEYGIEDYSTIEPYYNKKFNEEMKKLDEKLKQSDNSFVEKIQEKESAKKSTLTENQIKRLDEEIKELQKVNDESNKQIKLEIESLKTYKNAFDANFAAAIAQSKVPKQNKITNNKINILQSSSYLASSNEQQLLNQQSIQSPITGGSRQKSSNIHTFYKDYQKQETKGGGQVKQIFRL